jgi:hypothetical protein
MKVASITEAAISQGLKLGVHSRTASVVRLAAGLSLSAIALISTYFGVRRKSETATAFWFGVPPLGSIVCNPSV